MSSTARVVSAAAPSTGRSSSTATSSSSSSRRGGSTIARAVQPPSSTANKTSIAAEIVGAVLKFPPLWEAASKGAKEKMIKRAGDLGVDWQREVESLRCATDWEKALADATDDAVLASTPAYYKTSFHAYPEGNLGWPPAHEVEVAAVAVHAVTFSDDGKTLDANGDEMLRRGYHDAQALGMDAIGGPDVRANSIRTIVDVGCSSGLSTRELVRAFPDATRVVGIDLSPHFIAVARHALATRRDGDPPGWGVGIGVDVDGDGGDDHGGNKVSFAHAAGERLPFEDGSVDLVSSCLVFHELPSDAAAAVIADAFRALRPGGYFTMMDMDPTAPAFERIANNVFAFTAFKSTEPYLEQYASLDVQDVVRAAGFEARVETLPSSPRHRTIVARKPCA